jgi:fido (protein-threonine AMPylation protein)
LSGLEGLQEIATREGRQFQAVLGDAMREYLAHKRQHAPRRNVLEAFQESLVQNHPFVDGNKRVAFAVVDVFLRINGHLIAADSKAIYDYIIKLFEERAFDMEHLVPWLQEIVRPRD